MKYLTKEPIVFGSEGNKTYEDSWERIFTDRGIKVNYDKNIKNGTLFFVNDKILDGVRVKCQKT